MTTLAVQDGTAIHVTAPTGGYTSGQVVDLTDIIGIVHDTAAAGVTAVLLTEGVFTLTKTGSAHGLFTQGDKVYQTTGGNFVNNTSTGAGVQYVGIAWTAAATGATSVNVRINFGGGA